MSAERRPCTIAVTRSAARPRARAHWLHAWSTPRSESTSTPSLSKRRPSQRMLHDRALQVHGTVAVAADEFTRGGLHPGGRQPLGQEGQVVDDHVADGQEGLRDAARAVGGEDQSLQFAGGVVGGDGFVGPDVDAREQPPSATRASSAGKSTTGALLTRTSRAPSGSRPSSRSPSRWRLSSVTVASTKTNRLRVRVSSRVAGTSPCSRRTAGRQPGVVDAEGGAEGRQERVEAAAEVPEADQADVRAAQQDGVGVAVGHVPLASGAEGAVLAADAAREVEREPEGVLGDGLGVGGSAAQDVDAAREARRRSRRSGRSCPRR